VERDKVYLDVTDEPDVDDLTDLIEALFGSRTGPPPVGP
jgi:hypothetical protein